jgi:MFS family permease
VLIGLGMGAALTPLNSLVLEHVSPQRAGGAAGTLSTVQQVGNAIGVAVMGVVFFGLGDHGLGDAFAWCEVSLTAAGLEIAFLSRFLARGAHADG